MQTRNTDLIATVAHDLQTPLAALKAHIFCITKNTPPCKDTRTCNDLIDCMSAMIHDLLAYARSATHPTHAPRRVFSMSDHVANVLEYVDAIARSYKIRLIVHIEQDITVRGVPERIEEALLNVLSNSMKYLETSGVRVITVSLTAHEKTCHLIIKDTGIGIPANELPHIFTRFYRTTLATRHASGSGLGLAITKNIIEAHKGDISIESIVNKGTTVTIHMPLHKKGMAKIRARVGATSASASASHRKPPGRLQG